VSWKSAATGETECTSPLKIALSRSNLKAYECGAYNNYDGDLAAPFGHQLTSADDVVQVRLG
jgi:hypothetical protein